MGILFTPTLDNPPATVSENETTGVVTVTDPATDYIKYNLSDGCQVWISNRE